MMKSHQQVAVGVTGRAYGAGVPDEGKIQGQLVRKLSELRGGVRKGLEAQRIGVGNRPRRRVFHRQATLFRAETGELEATAVPQHWLAQPVALEEPDARQGLSIRPRDQSPRPAPVWRGFEGPEGLCAVNHD